jgi:hypothetical protein
MAGGMAYDEELAFRIRAIVADEDGVTEQRMFGGLAFLVNGNMAVAASGQGGLLLHVPPASTDELLSRPHASPMEMRGKEMAGWLRVADDALGNDTDLEGWVAIGVDYARALPPKGAKKAKTAKKAQYAKKTSS